MTSHVPIPSCAVVYSHSACGSHHHSFIPPFKAPCTQFHTIFLAWLMCLLMQQVSLKCLFQSLKVPVIASHKTIIFPQSISPKSNSKYILGCCHVVQCKYTAVSAELTASIFLSSTLKIQVVHFTKTAVYFIINLTFHPKRLYSSQSQP